MYNQENGHDPNEVFVKLISQASAARDTYSKLINTKLASSFIQQQCQYDGIVSELVHQGTT